MSVYTASWHHASCLCSGVRDVCVVHDKELSGEYVPKMTWKQLHTKSFLASGELAPTWVRPPRNVRAEVARAVFHAIPAFIFLSFSEKRWSDVRCDAA